MSANSSPKEGLPKQRRTGYVFEELYLWHDPGSISYNNKWVQPGEAWENKDSKSRFHSLLCVSGLADKLIKVPARKATRAELCRFHTEEYHDKIKKDSELRGGDGGEVAQFGAGSYEIAALSAGGVMTAVEAVLEGRIDNAYCLVRPPGHHALADMGMGFCLFNNIVVAALHSRVLNTNIKRIAIVDYDVHHGNGTQSAFWNDSEALFISIHQDNNYPRNNGLICETGGPDAVGTTINLPLPPGSGVGAYMYAFDTVVLPALRRFCPDMVFVSSGYDASYADPLGSMMLSSESFGVMASKLQVCADDLCAGRIVYAHEGGYSKDYVPFCGLAVVEAISGCSSGVIDPYLSEVKSWGYQDCLPHQAAIIDAVNATHGLGLGLGLNVSNPHSGNPQLSTSELGIYDIIDKVLSSISDADRRAAILLALSVPKSEAKTE
jgi:acetoin utilization deacetylase AcuC-like enzyme